MSSHLGSRHLPAPPGATEWLRSLLRRFVAEQTAEFEAGRTRAGTVPMLVGVLASRCNLTNDESDALLAVLNERTPDEFRASVTRAVDAERP